ncbi:MAG: class I adenylate-forming enzyme family protein [Syntrophales bacterium]
MNISTYFRMRAREFGDNLVAIDGERKTTYSQLEERSNKVANWLKDTGIKPGERAIIYLPNCTEYFYFMYGAYKAGIVAIPLNYRFQKEELRYVLKDSGAVIIFTLSRHAAVMSELQKEEGGIQQIVIADGGDKKTGTICLDTILDKYPFDTEIHPALDSDIAMIMYTSGTTGRPKGVKQTHRNNIASAEGFAFTQRITSSDRFFCIAPLFHVGGTIASLSAILTGGAVVFTPGGWDPIRFLETVEKNKVTWAFLVGLMGAQLATVENLEKYDLSSLKHVAFGGSPIPAAMYEKFEKKYEVNTFELYGRTEHVGSSINYDVNDKRVPGSVGKLLTQIMKGKLVDPVSGKDVAPGQPGELIVIGENITPGYWNKPEENAKLFTKDGWQHTGDVFVQDENGYLFFKERTDDMIISGGENIYPGEIIPVLAGHPKVADAFVLGVPHDDWGQQVAAVIVKKDPGLTEQELLDFCGTRKDLSGYKKPRAIKFVDAMPKTASMKIDKGALLKLFKK